MARDSAATPATSGTVLYIEDNQSNVLLLERIIERRPGVTLLVAMHGRVGLEMAFAHQPDLVLLDLHLPDMRGEDVLIALRTDARTAATRVVVLTADATRGQSERLMRKGASGYLTKPYDIARLLGVVDELQSTTGLTTGCG